MKYFTVVGSKALRLNSKYQVLVSSHGDDEKIKTLSVALKRQGQENSEDGMQKKIVKVDTGDCQLIEFDPLETVGEYFLEVKSVEGENFEQRVNLNLNLKKCSVLIQTDKAIYKPSEKVQFRVLLLDINSRPYLASEVAVHITDGAQNRVKQFSDPKFTKGVFQDELQLSDSPVMGDWKINVAVDGGKEESKTFEVAEYVLPKFEAFIETQPNILFKDGKIRAKVFGKYTYGKLAKGKAKVTAKPIFFSRYGQPDAVKVSQTINVDGKADVEFDLLEDLEISKIDEDFEVKIEAIFTEELTQRKHKASSTVKVHKNAHSVEVINAPEKFKPGLPFTAEAVVKNIHGDPVTQGEVEFTAVYHRSSLKPNPLMITPGPVQDITENVEKKVSIENCRAIVNFDVSADVDRLTIKAKFLEVTSRDKTAVKVESTSNQFIQMRMESKSFSVGDEISILVTTTEEISSFTYVVSARNNIVESKTIHEENSKGFEFKLLTTKEMSPKINLVVFYIRADGELVSDRTEMRIGFKLDNQVKLELSTDQSKPGQPIEITVKSNPNSIVGLLGVDQSVTLLKSGNDIDMTTVVNDFDVYLSSQSQKSGLFHYESPNFSDFTKSKTIVITNAKDAVPVQKTKIRHYMKLSNNSNMIFGGVQPMGSPVPNSVRLSSLARPTAFSAPPPIELSLQCAPPPPKIRKTFPETWIFDSFELESDTKRLTKKVPDTITSWMITGFAVDPSTGLGLTEIPAKLNVFQPFFVSTNLPYSIKQGETVAIPINVFNYLEEGLDAAVTLFNEDGEFDFVENGKFRIDEASSQKISVKSNSGSNVNFMIKPKKSGNIKIKVTAISNVASDGLEQLLVVQPEGVTQHKNEAFLIDLRNVEKFDTKFSIEIPEIAVPDSTKIEVSAIGDILGPSIENLDKLIRIPFGCGEQNMLNFVPNIIVLDYLTAVQKLTPEIAMKAKKYMETGYQRELTYKHHDGSYSAFGGSDKSGSTWLTAFVAKSFHQASKYIQIDREIIDRALSFLTKQQQPDGSFKEVGTIFHKDMQGGSSNGLALTAYVLISILESQDDSSKFKTTTDKTFEFIANHISSIDDEYTLAIVAYALQVAKHPMKDSLMEKLSSKAQVAGGLRFWKKSGDVEAKKTCWSYQPNAINVEMTAYALQAHIEADAIVDGISIMKWLVGQRNENGGFQSTQDTVVGLQALARLAAKVHVSDSKIEISVKHECDASMEINVDAGNSMILQKFQLPAKARSFEVSATGRGFCLLQLSYKFNMSEGADGPSFILEPKVNESENKNILNLTVGTAYIAKETSKKSNMAVMEVSFPSGFVFDVDHLEVLKSLEKVQKVETKDGETVVIVYFYDIDTEKFSLDFKAIRSHDVGELKPASVLIYDYYDNARRATTFYDAPSS